MTLRKRSTPTSSQLPSKEEWQEEWVHCVAAREDHVDIALLLQVVRKGRHEDVNWKAVVEGDAPEGAAEVELFEDAAAAATAAADSTVQEPVRKVSWLF